MKYFSNSKHLIGEWVIASGELFRSVTIRDEFPTTFMTPVQQKLFPSIKYNKFKCMKVFKRGVIYSVLNDLGRAIYNCDITLQETLENSMK